MLEALIFQTCLAAGLAYCSVTCPLQRSTNLVSAREAGGLLCKKTLGGDRSQSTADKVLALHAAHPGSISGILYVWSPEHHQE